MCGCTQHAQRVLLADQWFHLQLGAGPSLGWSAYEEMTELTTIITLSLRSPVYSSRSLRTRFNIYARFVVAFYYWPVSVGIPGSNTSLVSYIFCEIMVDIYTSIMTVWCLHFLDKCTFHI